MNRLLNILSSRPTLIVSLPRNSPDLAQAAAAGGADIIKTHINVHHDASGTHFGSLAEERASLEAILDVGLPTAIVVGAGEKMATPQEMSEIRQMGFQALDAYAHFIPAWMFALTDIAKMVAVDGNYSGEEIKALDARGMDILEAAVVSHEDYGKPVEEADFASYRSLRERVMVPIVVPTQRRIMPSDLERLFMECRIDALMIGAIVTGSAPESIEAATKRYKRTLLDLVES